MHFKVGEEVTYVAVDGHHNGAPQIVRAGTKCRVVAKAEKDLKPIFEVKFVSDGKTEWVRERDLALTSDIYLLECYTNEDFRKYLSLKLPCPSRRDIIHGDVAARDRMVALFNGGIDYVAIDMFKNKSRKLIDHRCRPAYEKYY